MAKAKQPKSLVGPLRGNNRLKKAKVEPTENARTPKPKVFMVAIGTPGTMGAATGFTSEKDMRKAARDALMTQWRWCERLNSKGLAAIKESLKALDNFGTFDMPSQYRRRIECAFDPGGYNAVLVVELWRISPPPNNQLTLIKQ